MISPPPSGSSGIATGCMIIEIGSPYGRRYQIFSLTLLFVQSMGRNDI